MSNFDWSRFTLKINIKASPEKLYSAWSTQKGIEEWFLRLSQFFRMDGSLKGQSEQVEKGDSYKWLWYGWPDGTEEKGEILTANGKDEIAFSFGKAGNCTVTIQPYEDEYMVQLIQDQIPDTETGRQQYHLGCKQGWTFYLTNMKSVLEGGIDLRHRDIDTTDMVNK
jgi:uncharacterized protein YndB with AHSA1/START domain